MVVAGFLLRWDTIPKYWIWVAYINFLRYAWGGLMINQFQGHHAKIGQYDLLKYYSLDGENKWLFLLYEFLFAVAFSLATWAALHRKYARR